MSGTRDWRDAPENSLTPLNQSLCRPIANPEINYWLIIGRLPRESHDLSGARETTEREKYQSRPSFANDLKINQITRQDKIEKEKTIRDNKRPSSSPLFVWMTHCWMSALRVAMESTDRIYWRSCCCCYCCWGRRRSIPERPDDRMSYWDKAPSTSDPNVEVAGTFDWCDTWSDATTTSTDPNTKTTWFNLLEHSIQLTIRLLLKKIQDNL